MKSHEGFVSFVVPVYNGAEMVEDLYKALLPVAKTFRAYEMIFVDDGSSDESVSVLSKLQQDDRAITVVQLSRNFGQHNATIAGLAEAEGDFVVTLDQDLQNPPKEIYRLFAKLTEGFDVVYGLPEARAHNVFRNLTSEFSKWISRRILSTALKGNFSSFRLIRKWVVGEITQYRSHYVYLVGLISWTTVNVGGVQVRNDRSEFKSQYTFGKLVNHGLNLLVNFSIRPLQIASIVGLAGAVLGLVAAIIVIVDKLLYGIPVQGWASLMVVVLFMGGVQIVFLGLIGEYIGRILMNANGSPRYIIRQLRKGKVRRGNK